MLENEMCFYIQHTALLLDPSLTVEMTASGVAAGWINTVFSKLREPKLSSAGCTTSFCTGLGYSIGFISIPNPKKSFWLLIIRLPCVHPYINYICHLTMIRFLCSFVNILFCVAFGDFSIRRHCVTAEERAIVTPHQLDSSWASDQIPSASLMMRSHEAACFFRGSVESRAGK